METITIYNQALQQIENGARFKIDFEKRSLKVNGKYLIKDGVYDGDLGRHAWADPLCELRLLYIRYKHSVPSERTDSKRRNYFRALPEKELSDHDMMYGELREIAQFKLEMYVLCNILKGFFHWDDFAKDKWFWQCPTQPSLILLKKWIVPTNDNNIK